MLPLFDERIGPHSVASGSRGSTGADALEDSAPSADLRTRLANAVQRVEDRALDYTPSDGPLVIGDTLWRVDGVLVSGGSFTCWLVCAL